MLHFDPKILQALQKIREKMMEEARRKRMNTPSSSFATGGYVPFEYPPFGGGINWDRGERIINPNSFTKKYWVGAAYSGNHLFIKERFRTDLTTAQKMRAFKFIIALETAKEL